MISPKVMIELHQAKLVPTQFTVPKPGEHAWSPAEQRRFWEAIHRFPQGPWTAIAAYVGSKSTRQAMTHAQKLRQKLSRWKRRVRSDSIGSGCSSDSNSSASATVGSSFDAGVAYAGSCGSASPTSPTDYSSEISKLSIMDHIEEETASLECDKAVAQEGEDYEPMDVKPEFKAEVVLMQEFESQGDATTDASIANTTAHEDRYLEHLLSDIEPVLEHVAHFTNGGDDSDSTMHVGFTRPAATVDYVSEQAVYFDCPGDMTASEHKTMELSGWNSHQGAFYQPHQYDSPSSPPSVHAGVLPHYTSAEAVEFLGGGQRRDLHL
ncbi:hypothetical protein BBJ28_00020712 [Nothophytophthora sp. Chile5]|nr:hypothetical protein BBJ28_00020712 [Nothophytophthora sp. Chile5]